MIDGNLRGPQEPDPYKAVDPAGIEARAISLAQAITALLRLGVKRTDLAEIYCVGCDLSSLDLSGVHFTDSVLALADFTNATLSHTNFDGADIERTRFVSADLRDAQFTLKDDPRPGKGRSGYMTQLLGIRSRTSTYISGPNFNCADLRGADFSGYPIFGFVSDDDENRGSLPIHIYHTSFVGADLENVNFADASMFGAKKTGIGLPFPARRGIEIGSSSLGDYSLFEYKLSRSEFDNEKLEVT